jgi:hypothetical protein
VIISVSKGTDHGLNDRISIPGMWQGFFSLRRHIQENGCGAHSLSYEMGTGGSFLGIKHPGREADTRTCSCSG